MQKTCVTVNMPSSYHAHANSSFYQLENGLKFDSTNGYQHHGNISRDQVDYTYGHGIQQTTGMLYIEDAAGCHGVMGNQVDTFSAKVPGSIDSISSRYLNQHGKRDYFLDNVLATPTNFSSGMCGNGGRALGQDSSISCGQGNLTGLHVADVKSATKIFPWMKESRQSGRRQDMTGT